MLHIIEITVDTAYIVSDPESNKKRLVEETMKRKIYEDKTIVPIITWYSSSSFNKRKDNKSKDSKEKFKCERKKEIMILSRNGCKKHPKYEGLRLAENTEKCEKCFALYNDVQNIGIKETRKRKKSN